MGKYQTTHSIGDLVYTADSYGIDRDVIKAIKLTGLKEEVNYGIKSKESNLFLWGMRADGFCWFSPSQIFKSKEDADAHHAALKTKKEAQEAKEKAQTRKKRLEQLKREQEALLAGEEYDPYDDDDY